MALFLSPTNLDDHISTKKKYMKNLQGGSGGGGLAEAEENCKKIKQIGGFSLFFLLFGKAP